MIVVAGILQQSCERLSIPLRRGGVTSCCLIHRDNPPREVKIRQNPDRHNSKGEDHREPHLLQLLMLLVTFLFPCVRSVSLLLLDGCLCTAVSFRGGICVCSRTGWTPTAKHQRQDEMAMA